ncbi:hypothetical protein F7018_17105 [Tenacibaculum aiptasiae]|uniref:DoxX family membrane protein n=1 Tax=Tenacibaculum aiptasiae TaxID=426481 RepID=A0A7J5A7E7_9FLAO|nr:hypothetical protein [Tenacibaculum aiptasiae]KAB1153383.1 hypothetical protein F7018_17105 [Tenacibaculum aiptasiae]
MIEKYKNKTWLQLLVIYTRYLLGSAFVFASLIKIKGLRFTSKSGLDQPINSAWHFFETLYESGLYWKFIGIGQLVAGFLLMTQKYAKLGALVNLPIILNIFIITISYYFAFTPVITGLMLFANLFLIFWDWDTIKVLFNKPVSISNSPLLEKEVSWQITGLIMFLFTFCYRLFVNAYEIIFWTLGCMLIGTIGLVIGLYKVKQKNPE